ncbi:sigma 54-interacting transcriptional regulator [Desulfocurvus sp.]|uniref:sigma-54 interaction domain-containing protein n=1 Tax=Desulfocurvus sp. TaxID=2871698 RepID=UPI0025BC6063|nr:sigma 54-interacting transcriptional regulator [Desulfocurvus sp.]MCK9240540.1 sigma 54-interacting transcriptional regulator [Desulfocurvus sp.]
MPFPKGLPAQAILDSLADGVFTVDPQWNVTFFNRAAARITGIEPDEALGRKCWEVFRSSLCDGGCALRACIQDGGTVVDQPIFIVRADGERVPVSISAAPLAAADGTPLGGVETFRDLTEIHLLRKAMEASYTFEDIVGKSPALEKLFAILPQVAASPSTALLTGESGTGKELFARALHNLSARKDGPFVAVNCGALPETLLESELFGYKAGAFTDARRDKPGRFDEAAGGTLFLDEIGDMPPALQVKLLRVLQDGTYRPLGDSAARRADVRVVAATNQDLEQLVAGGRFRNDLYYRLNVVRLRLPPLRERREDIPLLAAHFVRKFAALRGKPIQGLDQRALAALLDHPFPGNVRELENAIEFAFILCPGGLIRPEHLPEGLRPAPEAAPADDTPGPRTLEQAKCLAALGALERNAGRVMAACRELAISKDTLRRLLRRARELGLK